MALPSAQLGSLGSMSSPGYIPTQVIPKDDYWKKALVGVLANVAAGAATQGVGNAMSRDYAGDFGETPAGGFEKLVSGPKVNEKEMTRRKSQKADDDRLLATAHLQLGGRELDSMDRQDSQRFQRHEREMGESNRRQGEMLDTTNRAKLQRQSAVTAAELEQLRQGNDLIRQQVDIASRAPLMQSQIAENQSQAGARDAQTAFTKKFLGGGDAATAPGGAGQPTDAMRAHFQSKPAAPMDPQIQQVLEILAERLRTAPPSAAPVQSLPMPGGSGITQEELLRLISGQ